jgi:hypothetical protein
MSTNETGERGRAEPIDVEFEPADRAYRGGGGGIGMGAALFLALLSAGAGAAGGALAPRIPEIDTLLDKAVPDGQAANASGATSEAVAQLDTRLKGIEGIMNTPFAEAASAGAEGGDIAARTFALQAGLRDISARLDTMPSTNEVSRLVGEVQRLQQELPAVAAESRTASEAARAAFAVAAAAEASRSSGPFQQSYDSLAALLPNDANVAALAPLARTGAPTRAELRDTFDEIDNRIIRAARVQQAGAGFWGRIQAALADYIIVRRQGEGDTPDGVVELAGNRLAADDLAGAIEALSRLSGQARQVADREWLNDAKRRLEIDQRLAAVRTELSRRG